MENPLRLTPWLACGLTLAALAMPVLARDETGSLEAYLRRMRAEREKEYERLRPLVEELVRKLGQSRSAGEVKKLHGDLENLGSETAPLLVPYLDPGVTPTPEQEKQAQEVAVLLAHARNPALLESLVRLANQGSPRGRQLAVRVLGESPEVARALEALHALHPGVSGSLRAECIHALARLAPGDPLIVAALSDPHPEVIAAGLRALANEPRKAPRPEVLAVLSDASRGADVLVELVDYLCVPGQEIEEEVVSDLVRFAAREDLAVETRLRVLEGLPRLGLKLTSRLSKEMEPLTSTADSAIRDGALVALTLLKDGKARRELMRHYDEQVKNNETWPQAYQRRGDIELRICEYREASKDYREALRLHGDSARLPGNRELWVNLARALVKDDKLKAAAEALEEFGLASDLRRALRADPDFQPLVENPRYKSLFD
jgi:tetratricopeptide (TPR) repeat protein